MSCTSRCRSVLLLVVLEFGAVIGVPVPPEKIRALMDAINRQTLAHSLPSHEQGGKANEGNLSS